MSDREEQGSGPAKKIQINEKNFKVFLNQSIEASILPILQFQLLAQMCTFILLPDGASEQTNQGRL